MKMKMKSMSEFIDALKKLRLSQARKRLIKELKIRNPKPYTYKYWEHFSWGDRIEWRNTDEPFPLKVVGWLERLPRNGDELLYETEKGDIAVGYFVDVEYCGNPKDMFFAEIIPVDIIKHKE